MVKLVKACLLYTSHHLNSLINFQHNRHYRAGNGVHGTVQKMTGAKGEALRLEAPVGTIIRNAATGDVLADLTEAGQEVVILSGGRGGRGNIHFANSRQQASSSRTPLTSSPATCRDRRLTN